MSVRLVTSFFCFVFIPSLLLLFIFQFRYSSAYSYRVGKAKASIETSVFIWDSPGKDGKVENGKYRFYLQGNQKVQKGEWYRVIGRVDDVSQIGKTYRITLKIQLIEPKEKCMNTVNCWWSIFHIVVFHVRQFSEKAVFSAFPREHAEIILGILLGRDLDRDSSLFMQFQRSGMIHIAVASGSNIAMVALFSHAFISRISRVKIQIVLTIFAVVLYCVLVGFEPSLLRASALFFLTFIAGKLGRRHSSIHALAITIVGLLIISPFLMYSFSFQLSVLATFGLLFSSSVENLQRKSSSIPQNRLLSYISESFTSTSAAFLFTFPLLAFTFSEMNVIGFISNVVLLWTIPIIFSFSLIYIVLSLIIPQLLLFPLQLVLWLVVEILLVLTDFFASQQFFLLPIVGINKNSLYLVYFVLFTTVGILLAAYRRKR